MGTGRAGTDGHRQVALLELHRSSGHTDHQCSDDLCTCPLQGMPELSTLPVMLVS
ncbi:unnamed protein product [Staurois parvus]|uniref:Uncharacterized protein n=1 Tax=Staurois parvus TaxID=386267 RepID=A0ABN9E9F3_9NEOB|nr:unnamed protein product [Staurois parvus]